MENKTNDEQVSLELHDITLCKQIIETASERGAFRANELQVVGLTYDRISAWLAQTAASEETTESAESVEQGEKND